MKHVLFGLLLAACVLFPHPLMQAVAPVEAGAWWLLAQPAVTAAAVVYATVLGLRARPWPVRKRSAR